jgi:hypothetical protein
LRSGRWRVAIAVVPAPAVVMPVAELAVVGIGVTAAGPGLDVVAQAALCRHVAAIVGAAPIEDFKGPANGSGEPTGPSEVDDPHGPSNTTRSISASSISDATVPGVTATPSVSSQTRPLKVS